MQSSSHCECRRFSGVLPGEDPGWRWRGCSWALEGRGSHFCDAPCTQQPIGCCIVEVSGLGPFQVALGREAPLRTGQDLAQCQEAQARASCGGGEGYTPVVQQSHPRGSKGVHRTRVQGPQCSMLPGDWERVTRWQGLRDRVGLPSVLLSWFWAWFLSTEEIQMACPPPGTAAEAQRAVVSFCPCRGDVEDSGEDGDPHPSTHPHPDSLSAVAFLPRRL